MQQAKSLSSCCRLCQLGVLMPMSCYSALPLASLYCFQGKLNSIVSTGMYARVDWNATCRTYRRCHNRGHLRRWVLNAFSIWTWQLLYTLAAVGHHDAQAGSCRLRLLWHSGYQPNPLMTVQASMLCASLLDPSVHCHAYGQHLVHVTAMQICIHALSSCNSTIQPASVDLKSRCQTMHACL